jgi:hypothetical protein
MTGPALAMKEEHREVGTIESTSSEAPTPKGPHPSQQGAQVTVAPGSSFIISDLAGCYQELLEGQPVEKLLSKYVRFDVMIAQQLYAKGVTLEELRRSQERRTSTIAFAFSNAPKPLQCREDGLMLFDLDEYRTHVRMNPGSESILQEPVFHVARRYGH